MKKANLLFLCLFSSMILSACGSMPLSDTMESISGSSNKNSYDYGYTNDSFYYDEVAEELTDVTYEEGYEETNKNNTNEQNNVSTNRKLVKKVYLEIETENYDEYNVALYDKIEELGGYIENSSSYGNSITYSYSDGRYSRYVIRIPQDKLSDFVSYVENGSNILTKEENVTDVTLEYVDLEARKKSLLTEETRLIELLEKAENLTDVIQLEDKLSSVRYEIDSIESSLRTFDSLVDYSTITLEVNEVERYTEVPTLQKTPFERMSEGFKESINDIKDGFINFCIGLVIASPYLFVIAIVITINVLVITLLVKFITKKCNKKKSQQPQQPKSNEKPIVTNNTTCDKK